MPGASGATDFTGLSCAYLMEELARVAGAEAAQGRVILAHLGNGASLTAVRGGKSMDTSMSFTPDRRPAHEHPFGRSGSRPGLVSVARRKGDGQAISPHGQSRIRACSAFPKPVPTCANCCARSQDVRAAEAVALFCYQAKKWICAYGRARWEVWTRWFSPAASARTRPKSAPASAPAGISRD